MGEALAARLQELARPTLLVRPASENVDRCTCAVVHEAVPDAPPAELLDQPNRYFLEWLPAQLEELGSSVGRLGRAGAIAQLHLTGDAGGSWYFDLNGGAVKVHGGQHPKPSFTLTLSVDTWRRLNLGQDNGLKAYLRGDVKITGSRLKFLRVARLLS